MQGRHAAASRGHHATGHAAASVVTASAEAGKRFVRRVPPGGFVFCWVIAVVAQHRELPGGWQWTVTLTAVLALGWAALLAITDRRREQQQAEWRNGDLQGRVIHGRWQDATVANSQRIDDLEEEVDELRTGLRSAFSAAGVRPPARRGHLEAVADEWRGA